MTGPEIDPIRATSLELNRRAFVGIAAAATADLGSGAKALAQTTLGQPHPPLVAEDDPAIRVEHVELHRPDATVPAYAAWPIHARPNTPCMVVVMHIWGVDTSIRDVVRRFAKAGFAALAPDLYARLSAPSGDGVTDSAVFRSYAKQLDRKQYDGDIRAAALYLTTKYPAAKVGIVGFCMGGHIVLLQAIDNGDAFAAACPFYGAVNDVDPQNVHIPICGSYGARDTGIPAADVRAFGNALRVPNDIRIYEGAGHAFFDDQRSAYVATAAADAWQRTIVFLTKYLEPNP